MPIKKDDLTITLLQEVREDQKTHSTILIELQQDVSKNTIDLTEHKLGVQQCQVRLDKLEELRVVFKILKKYVIGIGAISISVYAILKILGRL